jgi:N utilization substance protein B
MGQRRKARESALQILYQLEFDPAEAGAAVASFWKKKRGTAETREYSRRLVEGVLARKEEVDAAIQSVSEHWRVSRMAVVDRNILRLAAFELLEAGPMAPAIVINEAIEIAKKYSGPEAATFVNGVLDALRKRVQAEARPGREVKNVREEKRAAQARPRRRAEKV